MIHPTRRSRCLGSHGVTPVLENYVYYVDQEARPTQANGLGGTPGKSSAEPKVHCATKMAQLPGALSSVVLWIASHVGERAVPPFMCQVPLSGRWLLDV